MADNLSQIAIDSALKSKDVFVKFLSANDSGETGGHQSGVLLSKTAKHLFFTDKELEETHILKKPVRVKWQNDIITDSVFTWYESKGELRLTRFGRGFDLLRPEYTGALFVFSKKDEEDYDAFLLNTEDDIQNFLDAFGLTPAETNRPIELDRATPEAREKAALAEFAKGLQTDFPSSEEMSRMARLIQYRIYFNQDLTKTNPDKILLDWTEEEYRLFRFIEHLRYGATVANGFKSVDDFIVMANKVLNRRKSRAGKSLEHHLSAIFDENGIQYTPQGVTEGNKKPDFIFPSEEDYHNSSFEVERLCTLAAKTTCKDRWRQVLNEADRLRDRNKYLCTMQQGISSAQMDEMEAERVILVVPKAYISTYPRDKQHRIWTIKKFVDYVREMEGL